MTPFGGLPLRSFSILTVVVLGSSCEKPDDVGPRASEYEPWTVQEELRIGALDDPEYAFGAVGSLAVGPDGRIYTAHPQELEVRIWTPAGEPAGRVGGRGEGPGEFLGMGAIGLEGDALWVMDSRQYRLTYFGDDGEVLRDQPLTVSREARREDPVYGSPYPISPFGDGTFYGMRSGLLPQMAGRDSILILHLRLDAASSILDTLLIQPLRRQDRVAVQTPAGQWLFGSQPFADGSLVAVGPGDQGLVVLGRRTYSGTGEATFQVTRLSRTGDTLFHRDLPYGPRPVDPEQVKAVISSLARSWKRQVDTEGPGTGALEELATQALYAPEYAPPATSVVLGRDGTIWLRGRRPRNGRMDWRILDQEGWPLAIVDLPAALQVREADRDHVWGVRLDSQGVPFVERYGLVPVRASGAANPGPG